jgi:hypothetical protein
MKHRFVGELSRRRLVGSFAVLLVVLAAGAQVLSPTGTVRAEPPVPVITVYLSGDLARSSLTVATLIGTLDGIARTPSTSPGVTAISAGGTSTSPGGTFETPAPPPVAEEWLRKDWEWLDKNMLLWMNRHPVLLKQP